MRLRLIREPSEQGATLGCLFVNGRFFAFTLEDQIREIAGQPVESWKIPGQTAIPAGTYAVHVTWSPKFQKSLPEVGGVPGFTGVRMHSGNRAEDTDGCVLVGLQRASASVLESRMALAGLMTLIEAAQEAVTLTVENPA